MAQFIKANGEIKNVEPKNGTDFSLEELNGFVGGYIEVISNAENYMVVNEEGKIHDLPINIDATTIARAQFGLADIIVGDVLVCRRDQIL